ncbi:MAG: 1-(5-phosphoribosyl)-5-[(5-phosphoribosylamino)methylideneamino]imidazole-4-carboxamide isomerase [Balneolaceae bacterium]
MKIIPAIDLLDGEVVRLTKGDYEQKTIYNRDPVRQADLFRQAGFKHIHVVDLNGARSGRFENLPHIREIIRQTGLSVQTGGGIRTFSDIETLLDAGVEKVICSSMAVKKPEEWLRALRAWPSRTILGLDLKDGKMAFGGWLKTSDQSLGGFMEPMFAAGLREVLSTDISRDGTLEGPNVELYRSMKQEFPSLKWIASGGVSSVEDLISLREAELDAVVVGKAYYEGKVTLEELTTYNRQHLNDEDH